MGATSRSPLYIVFICARQALAVAHPCVMGRLVPAALPTTS